jgi:hypothetical protein
MDHRGMILLKIALGNKRPARAQPDSPRREKEPRPAGQESKSTEWRHRAKPGNARKGQDIKAAAKKQDSREEEITWATISWEGGQDQQSDAMEKLVEHCCTPNIA